MAGPAQDGEPDANYPGLHNLRHVYASWRIDRRIDGGLELPAKVVQERLGHSSITMTLDTYSHLCPRGDDAADPEAAERALLGRGHVTGHATWDGTHAPDIASRVARSRRGPV